MRKRRVHPLVVTAVALTALIALTGCRHGATHGPTASTASTASTARRAPAGSTTSARPKAQSSAAARRAQAAATPPPIPILMYHVIASPPPHYPWWRLFVTPALFARQMAALRQAGYQAITLRQAYAIWAGRAQPPAHPVVLSFDDGYQSQYTAALPVLRRLGWPALLNLQVGRIGVPGGLSQSQVRGLLAAGWEVADHTVTHPDLTTLAPAALEREVAGSRRTLRRDFGVRVRFFCYPAGRYNPAVIASVRRAGFLAATTTWPGIAYPPVGGWWTLNRVRVDANEAPARLLAVLRWYESHPPAAPPAAFPVPVRS